MTPVELKARASALLATLQQRGLQTGNELIIYTQSNEAFIVAFWAAVLGGIVPVPVAVGISDEHRSKLLRIMGQLNNATLFTSLDQHARLTEFAATNRHAQHTLDTVPVFTPDDSQPDAVGQLVAAQPDDVAFIQYSSGSTGDPKGVCLTHKNVMTNIDAIIKAGEWTADDRALSWMPLTHDMGLIGFHLAVLAAGMTHAILDTSAFVRRPKLWLSLAAERRSTLLCSPNFGYEHLLKSIARRGLDDLDLSAVRQILNGAEPISKSLCDTFLTTLAPLNLKATSLRPVYGLAEATVGVSFSPAETHFESTCVDRSMLGIGNPLKKVASDHDHALALVHVGTPIPDVALRITDDHDKPVPHETVGHIQLRGNSVTHAIYGDAATTASLFTEDGWLRTGDSGAWVDGSEGKSLVIVGRIKDVLISAGQNYYAHDVEATLSDVPGAELGKVAVAAVRPAGEERERVAVFVLYRQEVADFGERANAIRANISARLGLEADYVVPVSRIPKTTSGKIQRLHLANAFMRGEFDDVLTAPGVRVLPTDKEGPDAATEDHDADAPAVDVCAKVVAIAQEFAESPIGPDDNLFEVGVSSLTLSEIALAIEEQFPGKLDVSDLFDHPTLRDIAAWVQRD